MMANTDRLAVITRCKQILLIKKVELLNRLKTYQNDFLERESAAKGDEADQSASVITEHQLFVNHQLLRKQLYEVEAALGRIEGHNYGICEETDEEIESDRLLAIPWTRLSLEGAEIREGGHFQKRSLAGRT
jgi:DnaK suppressor protein